MRDAVLELADALANAAATEEALADKLAALSCEADARGSLDFAAAFLNVARAHRAAAIRHRAQRGAIQQRHGMRQEGVDRRGR